ncbi:response regulator transcription factor [Saccharopolyspora shandongensis]|uniref:response regulator transcription factor n=1 Tax=Saccharopolyspora shandongensis TaxID=418495 RepID=UPI003439D31A
MIQLIIVAATRFYREGLALALQGVEDIEVVSVLAQPGELEADVHACGRAVVLLDIADLPDGPSTVFSLRSSNPGLRIIALGVPVREPEIIAYAENGVAGYLTRDHSIGELVRVITCAAHGELHCSPRVAGALSQRVAELSAELRPSPHVALLSHRETEIVVLLERGLSNQEISQQLCIALATVKNHVHSILEKLGLRGRAAAAAWARRQHLGNVTVMQSTPRALPPTPTNGYGTLESPTSHTGPNHPR